MLTNYPFLNVKVLSVSLKLKFRCKMKVEIKDGASTREVSQENSVFSFEEILKVNNKQDIVELILTLLTDKGSHYNGGVVKINVTQIENSHGSPIRLPISKCIDKQAWCQVEVMKNDNNKIGQQELNFSLNRQNLPNQYVFKAGQTKIKKNSNLVLESNLAETQSENGFVSTATPFEIQKFENRLNINHFQSSRKQIFGQYSQIKTSRPKYLRQSPQNYNSQRAYSPEIIQYRQRAIQAQDVAEFQAKRVKKLQQRLVKEGMRLQQEQEQRKMLQNSEQSYKLKIVILQNVKAELQRQLERKQVKIKESLLQSVKHKQIQKKLLQSRQQLRKIKTQNEQLSKKLIKSEQYNREIKSLIQQEKSKYEQELLSLKVQLGNYQRQEMKLKQKSYFMQQNTQKELINTHKQLNDLSFELQKLRKKRTQDQSSWKQKHKETQKMILNLKKQLKKEKDLNQIEKNQFKTQKTVLLAQISKTNSDLEKQRINNYKIQTEKSLIEIQKQEISSKINQLKKQNQRQQATQKQLIQERAEILQQNAKMKRKFQNMFDDSKALQKSKKAESQRMSKQLTAFNQKCREAQNKVQEMEIQMRKLKLVSEKSQRNQLNLQKQNQLLQQMQKQFKSKYLKKQLELLKIKQDLEELLKVNNYKNGNIKQQNMNNNGVYLKYQLEEHLQNQKLLGIYETQIKYLQFQIDNQKIENNHLKNEIKILGESNQKHKSQEQQWLQQKRICEMQKQQLKLNLLHFQREQKEIIRKNNEEQYKVGIVFQQIERQKKNNRLTTQRINEVQSNINKIKDEKELLITQNKALQQQLRSIQNQVRVLKGELSYYEEERKKYVKVNEELEFGIRKAREEINQLVEKNQNEAKKYNQQTKRLRDEFVKYENRLKVVKGQSDKFKQSLRNIIVQYLINTKKQSKTTIRNQEISSSNQKKREEKYGLTLTNQLLFKLQEYLKEIIKYSNELETKLIQTQIQLVSVKQEIILKTNHSQNSQTQLKIQLESLTQSVEKMKQMYEQRQKQSTKQIQGYQWQHNRLSQQLKKNNEVKQYLSSNLSKKQSLLIEAIQRSKTQINKLKAQLKQSSQKCLQLSQQVQLTQSFCFKLEQQLGEYRSQQQKWINYREDMNKQRQSLVLELQQNKSKVQQLLKLKTQLKQNIIMYQSQLQQYKIINQQYKIEIEGFESNKVEETSLVRNLMKEKENLLHQYLKSQEKVNYFESNQLELINEAKLTKQISNKLMIEIQDYRSQNKAMRVQMKKIQESLAERDDIIATLEEKRKSIVLEHNQKLRVLQQKLIQDSLRIAEKIKQLQKTSMQLTQVQEKNEALITKFRQLNSKFQQCQNSLRRQRESSSILKKTKQNLLEMEQRFAQLQKSIQTLQKQLTKQRQRIQFLNTQISQKDLCNFQLSSEKYKLEAQLSHLSAERQEQRGQMEQKIASQDAALLKLEGVCQQYEEKIIQYCKQIEKMKQQSQSLQLEKQSQKTKLLSKISQIQQEKEQLQSQLIKMQFQTDSYKEKVYKIKYQSNSQQSKTHQKIQSLEEKLSKKSAEAEKLKSQNDLLLQLQKKNELRIKSIESRLQQQQLKLKMETQSLRKSERSLKLIKQEIVQSQWSCQHQMRKLIKSKLRQISKVESIQNSGELILKSLQDSVAEVLKKYKPTCN